MEIVDLSLVVVVVSEFRLESAYLIWTVSAVNERCSHYQELKKGTNGNKPKMMMALFLLLLCVRVSLPFCYHLSMFYATRDKLAVNHINMTFE